MDAQIDYISNLDNNEKIIYIIIIIVILYFCVNILDVKLSHVLAFFVIIFVVYTYSYINNKQLTNYNTDIDAKLDSLLDFRESELNPYITNTSSFYGYHPYDYNLPPDYMYMDSNLIELFYDVKQNFYDYNPEAYLKALLATNELLHIRYDFERPLESPPETPFLLDNYRKSYKLEHSKDKLNKKTLINAYPNYQQADEYCRNALNHLQSFIITIPSEPIFHLKHQDTLKIAEILLKRNLDVIYKIYKNKRHPFDSIITDYDNTKPSNTFTGNFNFY
jgi:hypothetical protein